VGESRLHHSLVYEVSINNLTKPWVALVDTITELSIYIYICLEKRPGEDSLVCIHKKEGFLALSVSQSTKIGAGVKSIKFRNKVSGCFTMVVWGLLV